MLADSSLIANRYRVLATLGRGAMGAVYHVTDSLDGQRELALKLLEVDDELTPIQQARFKEEFRAMARLRHPNTLEVHDFGVIDARACYLTMELVPGIELAERLAKGPLEVAEFYALMLQLLQALGFIHSRGYVHRDIKSQNIRLQPDGTLKLMDFGLVCAVGSASETLTGTPSTMAPELIRSEAATPAADLYAVGCLAFELLTGHPPFEGSLREVLLAHLHEPPPDLAALRPDLPPRLVQILSRLLEKHPVQRYQDANGVLADLSELAGPQAARANKAQRHSFLVSSALVGREAELAALRSALARAGRGEGQACFVGAPAGVGKSRLVQEALLTARLEGCLVLRAKGQEQGMEPYEVLVTALRPLIAHTPSAWLTQHTPELCRLFHELAPFAPLFDHTPDKAALHETLNAWLDVVAEHTPIVWALDDLQWVDPYSLEAFNACIRGGRERRQLLLGTLRSDETPPGSPVWYTVAEGACRYMPLEPLSAEHSKAMITAMLRDVRISEHTLRHLYHATAGNAFFLTEALRFFMEQGHLNLRDGVWCFATETGPLHLLASVEETIVRRLDNLPAPARQLAGLAAVVGRHLDAELLAHVSALAPAVLEAHLALLVERQFMVREGRVLSFPHDRVREALYENVASEQRQALHQRCAEFLEQRHAERPEAVTHELAYHFSRGTDAHKAYRYLRQAGRQADERGAEAVALDYWLQADALLAALDAPERGEEQRELWYDIGFAGFVLYPDVAVEALEKLRAAILALGDAATPTERERLHMATTFMATAYGLAGKPTEGIGMADRALELVEATATPEYGATIIVRCAPLMSAGRYDEMLETAREASRWLVDRDLSYEPPSTWAARVGALGIQNATSFQGVKPSPELRDAALAAAREIGDDDPFTVLQHFGLWNTWTGRHAEATAYLEATDQKCRKLGAPPYVWTLYLRPCLLYQQGEYEEALAAIRQATRYPHLGQSDFALQLIRVLEGQVLLALGQLDAARQAFAAAEARGRERRMGLVVIRALLGRAELAIASERPHEAQRVLEEALALAQAGPTRNPLHEALALRLAGIVAGRWGCPLQARERFESALAIVERPEQDNGLEQGHVLRAWGDAALSRGELDEARRHYVRAAECYRRLRNAFHLHALNAALEGLAQPSAPSAHERPLLRRRREQRPLYLRALQSLAPRDWTRNAGVTLP